METQKDKKLEASEYAYDTLLSAFEELANKNQLDESTIVAFKVVLLRIYLEKKAYVFVENRLDTMSEYLKDLANSVLSGENYISYPKDITNGKDSRKICISSSGTQYL